MWYYIISCYRHQHSRQPYAMKPGVFVRKVIRRIRGGVVTLYPKSGTRGRVLLSYKTEPFVEFEEKEHVHSNVWECREIANIFLRLGYTIDVIDWFNREWKPNREYKYFIDPGPNLSRIGPLLNTDCIKILHAATSHWLFNNEAEQQRLIELEKRRGVLLRSRRNLDANSAIEDADFCTLFGNDVTEATYAYAQKKMHRIPVSSTHTYPFPEDKDIEKARKNFIWLGGAGMVHKGLDVTLEAFAHMPEYQLFVCGDVKAEKDFEKLYWNELYNTKNIKVFGRVDVGGDVFKDIASSSAALIFPSCAESQSTAVVTCMHAGLIPTVSLHSGVDVGDFGIILHENSVEEIMQTVRHIAALPQDELKRRSRGAWEYARKHHTRERFSEEFTKFVAMLEARNTPV